MNLSTHNLSFVYPQSKHVALQQINLSIAPQKMTAIMGLNGSGKSTLVALLSGFLKPTTGHVALDHKPLAEVSHKHLAQTLCVVPQDFPTVFPYRVDEFVMMGLFPWKTSFFDNVAERIHVQAILQELELTDFAARRIDSLSGGERQRVLLARALAQKTPLLLLDEPLNHLDIKQQILFLKKLKSLCHSQGKTIVAVMHQLHQVKNHFDEAIFLKDGQLIFIGPVTQAFTPALLETTFEMQPL